MEKFLLVTHPLGFVDIQSSLFEPHSGAPLIAIVERLKRVEPPKPANNIRINGSPSGIANAVTMDFIAPDFDRRTSQRLGPMAHDADDPPIVDVFEHVNGFLAKLRTITQAMQIHGVSHDSTVWRIQYLNDDGQELLPDPNLYRARIGTSFSWRLCGLTEETWIACASLPPDHRPHSWESLLLDAQSLLPQVGPALVLAYSALETFIAIALDALVSQTPIPPELWRWINERKPFQLQPSVQEQLTDLLQIAAGKNLAKENALWLKFVELRKARNTFVHQGRAEVDAREVTPTKAAELVEGARQIAIWLENLLPIAHRRQSLRQPTELQIVQPFGEILAAPDEPANPTG